MAVVWSLTHAAVQLSLFKVNDISYSRLVIPHRAKTKCLTEVFFRCL